MNGNGWREAAFIVYFSHDIDTWFVLSSCRGYLIPGSTRLIVQYCKHVISRSTTSDDLFVDTTLMATQSLTEENSDLSENEDVQEIEDPILVAVNAGASLRSPTSAVIARKRKLPANEGKYKQRGSSKTTVRTSAWDRITEYPNIICCG
ncbi:unnamed protein product [Pocillopora meandrina]|uniref:Uncharacterized protein n=1 Tax=Pocillopora meandrina TaxID=46732 RepID=A0AAU9Y6L9_9CNID|nr:unnamed protein product [Pocillopora meandrina]